VNWLETHVVEDLGKLWEVPAVPFLHTHGICVELFAVKMLAPRVRCTSHKKSRSLLLGHVSTVWGTHSRTSKLAMLWMIMVSILSGEKRSLWRDRLCANPSLVASCSAGMSSGIKDCACR
jgi:hypothetical protein